MPVSPKCLEGIRVSFLICLMIGCASARPDLKADEMSPTGPLSHPLISGWIEVTNRAGMPQAVFKYREGFHINVIFKNLGSQAITLSNHPGYILYSHHMGEKRILCLPPSGLRNLIPLTLPPLEEQTVQHCVVTFSKGTYRIEAELINPLWFGSDPPPKIEPVTVDIECVPGLFVWDPTGCGRS